MGRAVLQLFLLGLACGCSTPEVVGLAPAPAGDPGPVLAVAPLVLDYEPTPDREVHPAGAARPWGRVQCMDCAGIQPVTDSPDLPPCAECGGKRFQLAFHTPYRPALRAERLTHELARVLERRAGFQGVVALEEGTLEAARAAAAELLLEVTLDDARVELLELTWVHPLKVVVLVVSSILIFPAVDPLNWFLPGEVYGLSVNVRWRLVDAASGEQVAGGERRISSQDHFAAFGLFGPGRPWFVVGFLRVPNCLREGDWSVIAGQLVEGAEAQIVAVSVNGAESARTSMAGKDPVDRSSTPLPPGPK